MMDDKLVASFIGFLIGMFTLITIIYANGLSYKDGQIDALSGKKIIVEKVENERGELVWQRK